jgi:hypothetical protein
MCESFPDPHAPTNTLNNLARITATIRNSLIPVQIVHRTFSFAIVGEFSLVKMGSPSS